ncbi:transposable element Tcb1 transposase [Latimeria chalumnae]|uniref:transposable element Tcb1 transposase n=1 Tax=Latimeria chalumnae TaxID=7897 RepID=UPI00313AB61A
MVKTTEVVWIVERFTTEDDEITATEIQYRLKRDHQLIVSTSSIRKVHQKLGWKYGRARFCPLIREVNWEKRFLQAIQWQDAAETFDDVIFMDETTVELERHTKYSFRKQGHSAMKPRPKHPYKIHAWGAISKRGPGPLVVFTGTLRKGFFQEEIIRKVVVPYISWEFPDGHHFFQDNDPKHTASASLIASQGTNWVRTPPESPDMNPIEMVWHSLKHYIRRVAKLTTKIELQWGIEEFWRTKLTMRACQRYIGHLGKVIHEVVERKGLPTGIAKRRVIYSELQAASPPPHSIES